MSDGWRAERRLYGVAAMSFDIILLNWYGIAMYYLQIQHNQGSVSIPFSQAIQLQFLLVWSTKAGLMRDAGG